MALLSLGLAIIMKIDLGNVIAERSLEAVHEDGNESSMLVLLGTPARHPHSTGVFVPYQIDHMNKKRLWYAAGVDGFQALLLAMKMILVEIETLERRHKMKVRFNRDENGNLGFNNF